MQSIAHLNVFIEHNWFNNSFGLAVVDRWIEPGRSRPGLSVLLRDCIHPAIQTTRL